ncbi:hypothetical protein B7494_g4024 [Chlorociboria aeruginascens]|nr:hypothetical protein B7494_g4024 [Chlorociboria aeruginascens]
MTTRPASHAGSWYASQASTLSTQLTSWLSAVPSSIDPPRDVPVPGARVIIAPHAGYSYSGPCAAYAYSCLDLSKCTRIFLLGPSHALYLPGCALSSHASYSTPLGSLPLDLPTISTLHQTGRFDTMSAEADENEHSLEMHLPYIHTVLSQSGRLDSGEFEGIVPILVGNTNEAREQEYARMLTPYLQDPSSVFIVSSDFCHWGLRFQYTFYLPSLPPPPTSSAAAANTNLNATGISLKKRDRNPTDPLIHESIKQIDTQAMQKVEGGSHALFWRELRETGNTVCGRHPIGVVMAAIELLRKEEGSESGEEGNLEKGKFHFVRYERSDEIVDISDSSVSYASAFAVL